MNMWHSRDQIIKKSRCLAKMVLRLNDPACNQNDRDQMVQEAEYIEFDTRIKNEKETNT